MLRTAVPCACLAAYGGYKLAAVAAFCSSSTTSSSTLTSCVAQLALPALLLLCCERAWGWEYIPGIRLLDNLLCLIAHASGMVRELTEIGDPLSPTGSAALRSWRLRYNFVQHLLWRAALKLYGWKAEKLEFEVGSSGRERGMVVYLHRPTCRRVAPSSPSSSAMPLVVWIHGGGMVVGSPRDASLLPLLRELARDGVAIASVRYRLAPEHPPWAPAEDAICALEWLATNANRLGCDSRRIAVAGLSAGGNLAAIVAQHAAQSGSLEHPLAAALLVHPMGWRSAVTDSMHLYAHNSALPLSLMVWFWRRFCPNEEDGNSPMVAAINGSFGRVCPTVVVTGSADPLRDEGLGIHRALLRDGVDSTHVRLCGTHTYGPLVDWHAMREATALVRGRLLDSRLDLPASRDDNGKGVRPRSRAAVRTGSSPSHRRRGAMD